MREAVTRTDPRDRREATADRVCATPGDQPIVEMVHPVIEIADLDEHHRRHFPLP